MTPKRKRFVAFVILALAASAFLQLSRLLELSAQLVLPADLGNAPPVSSRPAARSDAASALSSPPRPPCHPSDILDGRWVDVRRGGGNGTASATPPPPYNAKSLTKHRTCASSQTRGPASRVAHEWEVSPLRGCAFAPWSGADFCREVGNRTVVLVGDSITELQYFSLGYLLGRAPPKVRMIPNRQRTIATGYDSEVRICDEGSGARIVYSSSSHLSAKKLRVVLRTTGAEIVVVNRGAHYASDDELSSELVNETLPVLKRWSEGFCRETHPPRRCRLFFRPTIAGHPGCSTHAGGPVPPNRAAEMRAAIANMSNYVGRTTRDTMELRTHHWWDFERQNRLQADLFSNSGIDGYAALNPAFDMLLLRPDMHLADEVDATRGEEDCLHYCLPGPPDVLNRLLLHELSRKPT